MPEVGDAMNTLVIGAAGRFRIVPALAKELIAD